MDAQEFQILQIGDRISVRRGMNVPPLTGICADKIESNMAESILVKIHVKGSKPVYQWTAACYVKKEEKSL
jgi:HD superfamily phosphohydrolase YqeK